MKKILFMTVLCICLLLHADSAVAFRFDDNQPLQNWFKMAEVFKKHHVRFSVSVNLLKAADSDLKWIEGLRKMEADGFEIMDHTPNHCTQLAESRKYPELIRKYAKDPCVDHASRNTLCFKYDLSIAKELSTYVITVTEGDLVSFKGKEPPFPALVELNGKHYYISKHNKKRNVICSFWNEKVNLPDMKEVSVKHLESKALPYPGVLECQIALSREACKKMGLKTVPRVWIQPGGPYPDYTPEGLEPILSRLGYVSAATYAKGGDKGIMDPFFKRNAFAMQWGDFSLESLNLAQAKAQIAKAVCCHRAPVGSSHFRAKGGKIDTYVQLHDELLAWLHKNKIKVLTQGQLADFLQQKKFDRNYNILESTLKDMDGNGIPDGFVLQKGCIYNNGVISFKKNARPVSSYWICGLPKGNAEFSVEYKGNVNLTIFLDFNNFKDGMVSRCRVQIKDNTSDWKKHVCRFKIPENAQRLNIWVWDYSKDDAESFLKNMSLTGI